MVDSAAHPRTQGLDDAHAQLRLSSGPTAVPVFLGDFGTALAGVVRVDSWNHLPQGEGGPDAGAHTAVLRSYWDNGGGYCYLANTAGTALEQTLIDLEHYPDVTILVPLELWGQGAEAAASTARAVVAYAADHEAMAVLHAARDHSPQQAQQAVEDFALEPGKRSHAALYHPWLSHPDNAEEPVPPVGAVTGIWHRVDTERGVWKAPANIAVAGGWQLGRQVSDQGQSEARSVNFLREFPGRGTLVWGTRTLEEPGSDFVYIPVRRLTDTVYRTLYQGMRAVAFDPNTEDTWARVRSATERYLHDLWEQGALMGSRQEEAYSVRIGHGTTMSDDEVKAGWIVLEVGLAALRPAEFRVVKVVGEAQPA
ncbi:phage tail sheath family protein [Nocardiopsis alba]|uniref:phage tail sheath family protein n=1 Tax=Nocardiopsis alba TaxID=53437 RepID=UPI0033A8BE4D